MPSNWVAAFAKYERRIEWMFLLLTLTLFLFSVADWLDLIAYEGFQPLRMVFLSAAIALQPVAALVRKRSMRLSWALLAAPMMFLVGTFVVAS